MAAAVGGPAGIGGMFGTKLSPGGMKSWEGLRGLCK